MNLASQIIATLTTDPALPALTLLDNAGTPSETHSRADLIERTGAWSTAIRMSGIIPGQPVAVALARDIDLAAVHIAAMASGTPVVPINTSLAARELRNLLAAAKPALVIATPEFAKKHREAAHASACTWFLTGESALAYDEPFSLPDLSSIGALSACPTRDNDAALMLFTSGTTGNAKSVPLSHANLARNLAALAVAWGRNADDRVLHMLPAHHFHGLVLALYGSLIAGSEIFLLPRFDARAALGAIPRAHCNLVMGVPTMYARMIDAAQDDDDLSGLRTAVSGSAPLAPKTWHAFNERFGVALIERYGLTETCIVATNPLDAPRAGSVGIALSDTDVALHTDGSYAEGAGARGEICVRSPSVTSGYGNDEQANADAFSNGWFHTGDLGRIDDDGYLWIDGRLKELIIVGGSNVIPGEIERVFDRIDGIGELAVRGAPDDDLGEVVAAFVVTSRNDTDNVESEMRAVADASLTGYKRPRRYVFLNALPRNAMGKIDSKALSDAL
jgi:malonyl-CoA/methylmalonyl-CoA synthetase